METNTIYYGNAREAKESGCLVLFKDSAAALLETRYTMENAITDAFDGWNLDRRCLDVILNACSAEAAKIILAATIREKAHDGRISNENKAWSNEIKLPAVCIGSMAGAYVMRTHPAILNGFVSMFRRWQAAK